MPPTIPARRMAYPPRRGRRGHGPDCPYWSTHRASSCPCCVGELKGDRAEQLRGGDRPPPRVGVPVGAPAPLDLTAASKPQELTACAKCFRPHQAPTGSACSRCAATD